MVEYTPKPNRHIRKWILLSLLVAGVMALGTLIWPYLSFLTDRDALRDLILSAGIWAPLVYMLLQIMQVVIAPIPGTVISLAGGYVFETALATLYAMIGTTIGFWIVFTVSKRYGRRVMKYFASAESVAKYDKISTSKSAYAFIAVGFLFPFIPDPILGYIAGTTPISTRVLMIIAVIMRTPGVLMTSLVGSQVGQGNYTTVAVLLVGLVIVLALSLIFRQRIDQLADKLYAMATRDNRRAYKERVEQRRQSRRRRKILRHRRKAITKKIKRTVSTKPERAPRRRSNNR